MEEMRTDNRERMLSVRRVYFYEEAAERLLAQQDVAATAMILSWMWEEMEKIDD